MIQDLTPSHYYVICTGCWFNIESRTSWRYWRTRFGRTTSTTAYLSRHIRLCDIVRILRSTMSTRLSEPFPSTAFAKRAFRCSAPATWNDSLGSFKSSRKTFLFSLAFNWHWHYLPPAPLKLRPNGAIQMYYYHYYYYYLFIVLLSELLARPLHTKLLYFTYLLFFWVSN